MVVILSDLVDPEIPAYPFWKAIVALNPSADWTYLATTISGLYELKIPVFGKVLPTTQILFPST